MNNLLTGLLAGAALTIASSPAVATAAEASQQAAADTAAMPGAARTADQRIERHEVRIHRTDRPHAMRHGPDKTEHLTTMLQLRPEQQGALSAFLAATGKATANPSMHPQHGSGAKTTPERLAEMESRMAQQQTAMKARIEATRTFYARLDERQRKVFDAIPMMMMAGPGFGPMLMPGHHGHHGPDGRRDGAQKPHT